MIATRTASLRHVVETLRAGGPAAVLAKARMNEAKDYDAWLEERDIISVMAALRRLSERELARIGMSHKTLALDVEDLVQRAAREREISREVLELVSDEPSRVMAAE